jgi:histone deacetylase 11
VNRRVVVYLALFMGFIGAHRFYRREYFRAILYILTFIYLPLAALTFGLSDSLFLALAQDHDWNNDPRKSWRRQVRSRIYSYGTILFLLSGVYTLPLLDLLPGRDGASSDFYSNFSLPASNLPIFYRPDYNVTLFGLENFHPFDSKKYGRIYDALLEKGTIKQGQAYSPPYPNYDVLKSVHTEKYLEAIKSSIKLTKILEIPIVAILPWRITDRKVLDPMRFATSGSILAAKAAMDRGWAINLGGGFHHAHSDDGGGFCVFADITLAIKTLRANLKKDLRVMIVDLDAHQGNGHERDFAGDPNTFILDAFNPDVYPHDNEAAKSINLAVKVSSGTSDKVYLQKVSEALKVANEKFSPELIVYNAGTDIMEGDPLGNLDISPAGIVERDRIVFSWARKSKVPIVMLLSGGYQKSNAPTIANSIEKIIGMMKN